MPLRFKSYKGTTDSPFSSFELNNCYFSELNHHSKKGKEPDESKIKNNYIPKSAIASVRKDGEIIGLPIPKGLTDKTPILQNARELRYKHQYSDASYNDPWMFFYYGYSNLSIMVFKPYTMNPNDKKYKMDGSLVPRDIIESMKITQKDLSTINYSLKIDKLFLWPTPVKLIKSKSAGSLAIKIPSIFHFKKRPAIGNEYIRNIDDFIVNEKDVSRDYYSILFDKYGVLIYIRHTPEYWKHKQFPDYLIQNDWCHWKNQKPNRSLAYFKSNPTDNIQWLKDS